MDWEEVDNLGIQIKERGELISDEAKSEQEKLSKRLIKDWIFEIEGCIELLRKEVGTRDQYNLIPSKSKFEECRTCEKELGPCINCHIMKRIETSEDLIVFLNIRVEPLRKKIEDMKTPKCQEEIIIGKPCGELAEYKCIENGKYYCHNCKVLMNVNGAGEECNDYHFEKIKEDES